MFFGTGSSFNINESPLLLDEDIELPVQSEEEDLERSEIYDDKLEELFGSF
ncbi:hypothetical protein EDO6_02355 [Paenibacillus xylanexedens]|nr:hypothetical protein EDO6_02355 [Paenibacillus xylanexedens]